MPPVPIAEHAPDDVHVHMAGLCVTPCSCATDQNCVVVEFDCLLTPPANSGYMKLQETST